jgi:hypothetical protein
VSASQGWEVREPSECVAAAARRQLREPVVQERLDLVEGWCRRRVRWLWPDVPARWHDTFTVDLAALRLAGRLAVHTRTAVTDRFVTVEYLVADEQLLLPV